MAAKAIYEYEREIENLKYWLRFNTQQAAYERGLRLQTEGDNRALRKKLNDMAVIYQGKNFYG